MASPQLSGDYVSSDETPPDDFMPIFYVGHHELRRPLPISDLVLKHAQDVGYDMLTTPITTPHFHSQVLTLISSHLSLLGSSRDNIPAPIIPPFNSVDTPLTPGDTVSQLIAYASPWIDLCSADPLISNISRQVLTMEIAYAAFCGVGNVIVPGPRHYSNGRDDTSGLIQYSRAIQEALCIGSYVQIAIYMPMYDQGEPPMEEPIGDLASFVREDYNLEESRIVENSDLYSTWDAWNMIRSICQYNSRLSVALILPRQLPDMSLQSRWFAEPLRLLSFRSSTFLRNKGGHPVLSKAHQSLILRYMRLKQPPWLLLCDVKPIPTLDDCSHLTVIADGFSSPSVLSNTSRSASLSPVEAAEYKENQKPRSNYKDAAAHLIYLRHLQRHQPSRSTIEKFGSGYQDYLQAPLQPLTDNLESVTYEVFEKDPVKYNWYEKAIANALIDWAQQQKPTSSPNGAVVLAVAGSGRGPLVTRALRASAKTGVLIEIWAVEKNPNAFVLLQRHNEEHWGSVVNVVKSDMRAWKGPLRMETEAAAQEDSANIQVATHGKVDILVSELLGSFADNELSPECLDGVQHVLATPYGISIPSSYTAHLTPILAPRLHADISRRAINDPAAAETPYVVMLHAIDYAAISVPGYSRFQKAWEFAHPLPTLTLANSEARRAGGVSGGGGGSMAGGDGANEHNARYARLNFVCKDRGVVNGIAGYFEAVLYNGGKNGTLVELSTRPDTIDEKSKDMISWFPIYFPLKNPLYFPNDAELEVSIWRQTDDRKVWYEWVVEVFIVIGPAKRLRVGISDFGSSRKNGCLM